MGSVLEFAPRSAASERKQPVVGVTAAIVIFPGIRYERRPEAALQKALPAEHEPKRDKPRPRH